MAKAKMKASEERRYLDQIDKLATENVRMQKALLEIVSIKTIAGEPWTELNRAPILARNALRGHG